VETRDRVQRLDERIARIARAEIAPAPFFERVAAPLYRWLGWHSRLEFQRLTTLLAGIRERRTPVEPLLEAALAEAEDNLDSAERSLRLTQYVPPSRAAWLRRVVETLTRVDELTRQGSHEAARTLAGIDPCRVAPPLRLDVEPGSALRKTADDAAGLHASRLIELELAAIDQIMEAARGETCFLARRRRLLQAARRLLLDASAALPLDRDGVTVREEFLTREITHLNRLQAMGIEPHVAIPFQAKQALRRSDADRLHACLVAMDGFALSLGDGASSRATERAIEQLTKCDGEVASLETSRSRSAREMFGERVLDNISTHFAKARAELDGRGLDRELAELARSYLAPGCETRVASAMLSVDGCCEVGAPLAPIRTVEIEETARLVSHPTPEMVIVQARGVADITDAIVDDPRRIILDLAAGRLLARRYVRREERRVERTHLVGEARIYLLDGSTSMLEDGFEQARARMRDAIILAELATVLERLSDPKRSVRLSLFYRYFTKKSQTLHRVTTAAEALAAMGDVAGALHDGGTNIERALLDAFDLIRNARRDDPDLARASLILVTDGDAPVDEARIRAAREAAGDVALRVSVIALGLENPVLRDLVARQRARGECAFYQFIDDERLARLQEADGCAALHLASRASPRDVSSIASDLEETLAELEEMAALERTSHALGASAREGREAARELSERDQLAVGRRYDRWFRLAADASAKVTTNGVASAEDVEATRVVLETVAEVVAELGGNASERKAEAIELSERLLADARLPPERFHQVLETNGDALQKLKESLHAAVMGRESSFDDRLRANVSGSTTRANRP